jgi:hypothetical protein
VVSAVGNPDLTPSLPDLIREGDPDALAGFRDAHEGAVRSYVAVACDLEDVDEACDLAFLDFIGRVRADPRAEDLERTLIAATRCAAAARFRFAPADKPARSRRLRGSPSCAAVPELLAASANGELEGRDQALRLHVSRCPRCTAVEQQMAAAEAAFLASPGPV